MLQQICITNPQVGTFKKISDKTHKKLTKLWKHREAGGWSPAAGKRYKEHLKGLKAMTTKAKVTLPALKSKSFYFSDVPKASKLSKVLKNSRQKNRNW